MSGDYATRRLAAIKEAAYAVLIEKGYKAASMLEIAKRAGSSNETLYRWFGNKQGLFASLVEDNASAAREMLEAAIANRDEPLDVLRRLGPVLLELVTGERAIALNRAAAGDVFETATLGPLIARSGRETIVPLIAAVLEHARVAGVLAIEDIDEAAATYVNLLIGDVQIRRTIGVIAPLSPQEARARGERAVAQLVRLCSAA